MKVTQRAVPGLWRLVSKVSQTLHTVITVTVPTNESHGASKLFYYKLNDSANI